MPVAAVNSSPPAGRKSRIAASFGAVSEDYAAAAGLQRRVAGRLAERIARLDLPPRPRILEVGCGTGFLTQALARRIGEAQWVVSDIAEPMVVRCRETLGNLGNTPFLAMDAEQPAVAGGFDLICSSLVYQWFDDLEESVRGLAGLLKPGGRMAFSTLARGSLGEWREAHSELGLEAATPEYPRLGDLGALWPDGGAMELEEERIIQTHRSAHAFAATLKAIGAHTPAGESRPLPAGALRRVMRRLDRPGGVAITYRVAYGIFSKGVSG